MAMRAEDVLAALAALDDAGIEAWLDGGWGVDALLGEQTREHDDLDLVIGWHDIDGAKSALFALGYEMFHDELPCSFVLGSRTPSPRCSVRREGAGGGGKPDRRSASWLAAKRIDIHPVTWDSEGGGIQAQPNGIPWRYPPEGFRGKGMVARREVRCLSAEVQVLCHDGYELDDDDRRDLMLLRDRLGVELPPRPAR